MPSCRICKHTFKALKFQTEHIDICTRCVNTLNESPEPANKAQARLGELLARGMHKNAERDLESEDDWKRRKARRTLDNFDSAVAAALPDWITKLLAKPENSTRDFKIMRAHRRGLLRMDGFAEYPGNWAEVARNIRRRDDRRCKACAATDLILDVHHIVYLSKHGTNQQHNLITLCRPCHQAEHGREFDWLETKDPESISPIQPPPGVKPPVPLAPEPADSHIDLRCPRCITVLRIPAQQTAVGQKLRCKQCDLIFLYGITRSESFHDQPPAKPTPAPLDESAPLTPKTPQHSSPTRATPAHWEAARAHLRPIQSVTQQPSPPPGAAASNSTPLADHAPPLVATESRNSLPAQSINSNTGSQKTPPHKSMLGTDIMVLALVLGVLLFVLAAAAGQ